MKVTMENLIDLKRNLHTGFGIKCYGLHQCDINNLLDTIEALQNENEQLTVDRNTAEQIIQEQQQEIGQRGTWIDQQATKILRLQEAIAKAREAIELYKSGWPTIARAKADEALEQIDKAEDTANRYDECPYWKKDRCTGYNCCGCIDCPHAKKYQPWLFVDGAGGGEK